MFFRSPTAANPTWRITPRRIQVALGAFWILDGALQLQPYFFSNEFIGTMIQSMAGGQPAAVAGPIFFMVSRIQPFHVYWNAAFAVIQFGIGLGLINSVRTARLALAVSFVWTLIVWWFGEGLGMLAMGMANPMTGAPGAVLLYAAVGILVWPSDRPPNPVAAAAGYSGDMAGRAIWSLLWFGFAGLMLLPVNRGADSFATILTVAAIQSPGPLAALDNSLAHL
ncbi:MAG TPA: hypothetical protein VG015_02110, partial [Candidatus Dormibacteraeota bacterium]|nr:hypothetical protein [Candidatus Dormibacteraeota bacterium]